MSYFSGAYTHSKDKLKVELDNATKSDLKERSRC